MFVTVSAVTYRARLVSVTKINRCGHCQMQYSETRSESQLCDRTRHWTCEQLNSAWQVAMTDSAVTCTDTCR